MYPVFTVVDDPLCGRLAIDLADDFPEVNALLKSRLSPWNGTYRLARSSELVDQLLWIIMSHGASPRDEFVVAGNMLSLLVGNNA
jgi:hypothetical protein